MAEIIKNEDVKILKQGSIDLMVESYSSVAAILQIRGMTEEQAISANIVTTTDRALQTTIIDVTGTPVFLTARTAARAVKRGQLYVKVSLRVDGEVVALLMAGYVAETHKITYPGGDFEGSTDGNGLIRSITGTDPAAGAELLETVPTGARWKLLFIQATLTPDATVATRYPLLKLTDGTATFFLSDPPAGITAGSATVYQGAIGVPRAPSVFGVTGWATPNEMILLAGYKIASFTYSLQAGDNWGAPQLLIEEWIEP